MIVLILPLFENHFTKICIPEVWATKAPGYNNHGWVLQQAGVPAPYTTAPSTPELAAPAPPGAPDATASVAPTPTAEHPAPPSADHAAPYGNANASPAEQVFAVGRRLLAGPAAAAAADHSQQAAPAADHPQPAADGHPSTADRADGHEQQTEHSAEAPVCGPGWTQLFPDEALHGIHIFIALTALVHVFYTCVCLTLCMLRMQLWWPWDKAAQRDSTAIPACERIIKSVGKSQFIHILMSVVNTFILPINQSLYLSMRRLFLEGLKEQAQLRHLPMDFPYYSYVQEAMQYSLCDVVAVSPLVWLFAIIQLIIPVTARIYGTIALCSITIVMMVAAGAKLHSIVVHLAARSCFLYSTTGMSFSTDTLPEDVELGGCDDLGSPSDQCLSGSPSLNAADTAANVGSDAPKGGLRAKYQGMKDAQHHHGHHKAPSLRKMVNLPANVLRRFKTYAVRAQTGHDLPSMFWFHRPWLLLIMFKIAYFQAAFCLTLVLFALWKDNHFLPEQHMTAPVITFFALLAINIAMSFFTSASVLPVYAIVSVVDKTAFAAAAEFAARAVRHEESMELARHPSAAPQLAEHEQQVAMEVLQKLQSRVGKMQKLVNSAQAFRPAATNQDNVPRTVTNSSVDSAVPPSGGQSPQSVALSPASSSMTALQPSICSSVVCSPADRGAQLWGTVRTRM